ncbi:MAG: ATP-binding protein, partial [Clostridiales bacterium]|nr:ATP-binding protein [Clostridiales bacterium]
ERWGEDPISIKVQKSTNLPFSVKINKGKLIQIIDNLVLNSEYWLKEDIKQGKITKGIITIDISSPYIIISDNGRGIDPNLEFTLFAPFISTKSNGRGLGLFIVKQLLDSEGCNIELLPERNNKKRLYKFKLDLGEIINE